MKKSVVVVDDQPIMASVYRAKFLAEGFQVEVAQDGEQALEIIERTKPDLVLLDLMLPKVNGIAVLKSLRANDLFKLMPVVVFSNSSQPGAVEDAWAAGATMVLSKSNTSPKQMIAAVHNALARNSESVTHVDEPEPVSNDGDNPHQDETKTVTPTRPVPQIGRILLLENNSESREMLSHLLTRGGHQTLNAANQDQALLLSEANHIDLVLTNRALCTGTVHTFCQQIRERRPSLPVVMYSMNASTEIEREAVNGGISKFLTTPQQLFDVAQISADLIQS